MCRSRCTSSPTASASAGSSCSFPTCSTNPIASIDGLRHFRFRGSEVIVFHLIDPAELTFPFDRASRFRDIELGDEVMAVPSVVRQEYLDAVNAAVDRYKRELGSEGIDYRLIDTSTPLEFALDLVSLDPRKAAVMPAFLSPLFLVGVAAAAIPIAIHLFYRRTEPVIDFAAMRYLRRAPVEHSRRRRLRELVLLALRVAALVLLALAFARPYLSDSVAARSGDATLVMIDTSASLSAPGRFDAGARSGRGAPFKRRRRRTPLVLPRLPRPRT